MSRAILPAIAFAATLAFFYLLGAFMSADFNLKNWDLGMRALVAMFGAIFSTVAAWITAVVAHSAPTRGAA